MKGRRRGWMDFLVVLLLFVLVDASATSSRELMRSLPRPHKAAQGCDWSDFYNATGGPHWTAKCASGDAPGSPSCWLGPGRVCQWYGVDCTADTSGSPETISLLLPSNNLTGHLPDSLARLCSLNSLVLEDNYIQSVSALGQYPLPNIWVINLARNNISALPPHFGNLTNLHGLALGLNPLGGGFPDWMKNLASLWILDLTECGLSGTLPDIFGGSLPFLFHLGLSNNNLTGNLPGNWSGMSQLEHNIIDLSRNRFTGPIPPSIFGQALSALVLRHNQLSGSIPVITRAINLRVFDAAYNRFTGPLHLVGDMALSATLIDVSHNDLEGPLSTALVEASNLVYLSIVGNLKMRMAGPLLPTWLEFDRSTFNKPNGDSFFCYGLRPITYLHLETSPEYLNYEHCFCAPNYYGLPPDYCRPCPAHGNCSYGHNAISWSRGYYPIFNDSEVLAVLPCTDTLHGAAGLSACNPHGNCSAELGSAFLPACQLCAPGTTGRLCSRCLCSVDTAADGECFFSSDGRCVRCNTSTTIAAATVLGACLAAALVAWAALACRWPPLYRRLRAAVSLVSDSGTLKITVVWLQITAALNTVAGGWPQWALDQTGIKWVRVSNLSTSGTGLECVIGRLADPRWNLLAYLLLPVALSALIVAAVLCRMALTQLRGWRFTAAPSASRSPSSASDQRLVTDPAALSPVNHSDDDDDNDYHQQGDEERKQLLTFESINDAALELEAAAEGWQASAWEWGRYMWLWMVYFLYFGLTSRTLEVFSCVEEPVEAERFMASLPWLRCVPTTEWGTLVWMGTAGALVYVLGIPLLLAVLLIVHRRRAQEPAVRYWLGHLYRCYRPAMHWYETAIIARRLAIAAIVAMLPAETAPMARVTTVVLVLLAAFALQRGFRPFTRPIDNALEEAALGTILLTFIAQTAWRNQEQFSSFFATDYSLVEKALGLDTAWYATALLVCLMVWHVLFFGALLVVMVWPLCIIVGSALRRRWRLRFDGSSEAIQ
ncbi:leucine rich repeat domain containing protein [Acanthamoeba castellanii str. Neff]|uniref:Leucine rich repeat domain containing protein n=1 Tax=Acanthamoeba castellanii (strain ATCC 30010 / Neff) TaxID=1257118 RepID=L8HHK1_ACACF|nr:leucine rich repeat domain containing protein [Acanthamoeba castellanii str. Neff]ELR24640.1 leucine rich repeat domain containing protein [Acanthamoeba castellanii str. Neff]